MDSVKLKLIEAVKPYPQLYVPEDPSVKQTKAEKAEKERLWRHIARQCGFKITTEAKLKFRLLVNYFGQHLTNVAHKKVRRYIPKTRNPNDRFVQLEDWKYYHVMQFMRPYVKMCKCTECAEHAGERLQEPKQEEAASVTSTTAATVGAVKAVAVESENLIKLNVGNMILNIKVQPPRKQQQAAATVSGNSPTLPQYTESEKELKDFFDLMLRSTLKLPFYHQDRVKLRLMEALNRQNACQ